MTDTATITVPSPELGKGFAARAASRAKDFIVPTRGSDSLGLFGLYVESVTLDAVGSPRSHVRYLIVRGTIYIQQRPLTATRATWKVGRKCSTPAEAIAAVVAGLSRPTSRQIGPVLIVELGADDISAYEAGQIPPARYRAINRMERLIGKYDGGDLPTARPWSDSLAILLDHLRDKASK